MPIVPRKASARARALAAGLALVCAGGASAQTVTSPSPAPSARPMTAADYRAETWIAAQNAIISDAADALNQVSARFSQGGGEVAELAARREALANAVVANARALDDLYRRPVPVDDPAAAAEQRAAINRTQAAGQTLGRDLRALNDDIQARFPAFAELTRPQVLTHGQTQALLGPDEALILLLTAEDATYIWAVTREGFDWARAPDMNEAALMEAVRRLRAALMGGPASRGGIGSRTTQARKADPAAAAADGPPPFDRALAHRLHESLIRPVGHVIGDKRVLMVVTSGPLGSLPLQTLVTAPPQGDDRDLSAIAGTAWLADRHVLATLPTVSSLRALRCFTLDRARERRPGCPQGPVGAMPAERSSVGGSSGPRVTFAGFGAPTLGGAVEANRGAPQFQTTFQDKLADPDALRRLPSLPGAARELAGVARQFGDKAHVLLADQATERAVRTSAILPRARYVVFATHGLLAGQSGIAGEPGLVFTPPAKDARSEADDGLLTASEAAQLRLSADFVVLSACNTASADGRLGGDGLSGLARAFFHAGAPAVLASHWEVSDAATAQLMVDTFANLDRGEVRGRGEALQLAQRKLRQSGRPEWAHPNFWAAFTLAGEPS
jgi:CHAT domain-containing protein